MYLPMKIIPENEADRLREVEEMDLIGKPREMELFELAEIASAICDTPISLVTIIDEDQQWFAARKGLEHEGTSREDSFCQHTLNHPDEVLVVPDTWQDDRFRENIQVTEAPHIRFYAGAPLKTDRGNVLGTLCVIDRKPRAFAGNHRVALKGLANKAMQFLKTRRSVREEASIRYPETKVLRKLFDQVPNVLYTFEMNEAGEMYLSFCSKGIEEFHPDLTPELLMADAQTIFSKIHADDLPRVLESIAFSFENQTEWREEYRRVQPDDSVRHVLAVSRPEPKGEDMIWYGSLQLIDEYKVT